MSKKRTNIDDALISRYMAGDATESEKELVGRWINASRENQQYFQGLKKIWDESVSFRMKDWKVEVDTEAAWSDLKGKIRNYQQVIHGEQPVKVLRWGGFYRAAAGLLLITSLYFLYQYMRPDMREIKLSASGMVLTDSLPDGSIVQLNDGAVLTYHEDFAKKGRKVSMTGEAYFEVKPDPLNKFEINLDGALIRVLGTAFNVRSGTQQAFIEVAVKEGTVALWNTNNDNQLILVGGETGRIDKNTWEMKKQEAIAPDVFYWNSKTLIFKDTPLEQVIAVLERVYGKEVRVASDQILRCKLSGRFRGDNLESILKNIVLNFNLELNQENGQFIIVGDGC